MPVNKNDIKLSFLRFVEDTKDDFFPDALNYKDLKLKQKEIILSIKSDLDRILDARNIVYSHHQYLEGDAPKSHHVVRHTIALHPFDRIVYSYILTYLAPLIEPNVSKSRYSHPLVSAKSKNIFGKRPIIHWLKFRKAIKKYIDDNLDYSFVVSTDIAGYFEYIHINDFKKQISNLLSRKTENTKKIVELLNQFLKCFSPCLHSSIPQGHDASSYLASSFLDFLDKDLEASNIKHFRYVDDIKIICKTKEDAKGSIIQLIHSLRKVNLNLSTIKTEIWERNGEELKSFCREFPDILQKTDNAVAGGRKNLIDRVLPILIRDTKKLLKNKKKEFDERLFRAYIWRIVKCYWFKNIKKYNLDYIGKYCLKLLDEMPGRTDTFVRFLILHKDRKYIQDEIENIIQKSVYSWQKVHLWRLLILSKKIKNQNLLSLARSFIRDNTKSENSKNYAMIFLGKHGNYNDRKYIASKFQQTNSYFEQRATLIAIQEYDDHNIIYNNVMTKDYDISMRSLVEYLRNIPEPEYLDFDERTGETDAFIS